MIKAIFYKEFLIAGKAKNGLFSLLTLILAFIFIFHFSLERNNILVLDTLIGLKWAIIFLLSFIFIGQSIWEEREGGANRINSVYIPSWIYFLSKSFVIFLILFIINIFIIFLFYVFFSSMQINSFADLFNQTVFLIPAGLSLSLLGVSLTQLSHATRLKEVILPVLLIPLSIPILLFGMEAERNLILFSGGYTKPLSILFAFSVFYGSLGVLIQELTNDF
jgi:heme exporter protein B